MQFSYFHLIPLIQHLSLIRINNVVFDPSKERLAPKAPPSTNTNGPEIEALVVHAFPLTRYDPHVGSTSLRIFFSSATLGNPSHGP